MAPGKKLSTKAAMLKAGDFVPLMEQRFEARLRATGKDARFGPFVCKGIRRSQVDAEDAAGNERVFLYSQWQMRAHQNAG